MVVRECELAPPEVNWAMAAAEERFQPLTKLLIEARSP